MSTRTGSTHPRLLLHMQHRRGFRSVAELRDAVTHGHARKLWTQVLEVTDEATGTAPLTAFTPLPGRSRENIKQGNREYTITNAAGNRVLACALATLVTDDDRYRKAALQQLETLFDENAWPEWQDIFHRNTYDLDADLRTGMLCRDIGLAYDWLCPSLTSEERQWIVDGLDRRGIQPYLRSVEQNAWWANRMNNWTTCIVGGLGICGMALNGEHPQAEQLIEMAVPCMRKYLDQYGPEGEFNENPAYAGSTGLPVLFFSAYRYFQGKKENSAELGFLRKFCVWQMYMTVPPGVTVPFGDGGPDRPASLCASFVPAVAAATEDPVLQWFYLTHADHNTRNPVLELLYYDATLAPEPPTVDDYPLGRAFPAHSGIVCSRTSWDPKNAACVVVGKAGHGGVNHTHPDAGQVTVRGYGKRLIRDLGSVSYPKDKRHFYPFNTSGHNVLTFNDHELLWDENHRARIVKSGFDNQQGSSWVIDTTDLYEHAKSVRRGVVHLFPGVVAVLDEATFDRVGKIRLRWHPETPAKPDADGHFVIHNDTVKLSGRIVALDGEKLQFTNGRHTFEPPYTKDRMGNPLSQRNEPYMDTVTESKHCRILSLFAVYGPDTEPQQWQAADNGWQVTTNNGPVCVRVGTRGLRAEAATRQ
ncbi:MAG: heparinase II/III family protein [Candidatus Pacebacteria bacterium]|nr:heparinase II/III family protein [Candidatus Paceibacterota bacterium]